MSKLPGKTKIKKLRRVAFNKAYVADFLAQAGDAQLGFAMWNQTESSGHKGRWPIRKRRSIHHRWKFFGLTDYRATGKIEIH
ncbi:MAG: hypothetical protein H0X33_13365 [Taibaiella sp.]|nr:hypothetical protein [Taibaiella sp.]